MIIKNLLGKRFGKLVVLSVVAERRHEHACWLCQCDCGCKKIVKGTNLTCGHVRSCGCLQYRIKPLIGRKFGDLLVLKFDHKEKRGKYWYHYWLCRCICGKQKIISIKTLRTSFSCGCKNKYTKGAANINWKGYGEISSSFFKSIEAGAIKRAIEFDITIEYVWALFLKQSRRCALSGCFLNFQSVSKKCDGTASLDRINSSRGYVEGNVQWVHKDINRMKTTLSQDAFIQLSIAVANYQKEKLTLKTENSM